MGGRIRGSLRDQSEYELVCVEADPAREERLRGEGFAVEPLADALAGAELVVMAVSDRVAGPVAEQVVPLVDDGAVLICLDPAAPYAGLIPERDGVALFVTHPTHPPLFDLMAEESPEARRDFWGGGLAGQALVNALVRGEEADYAKAERLARCMFRPIVRCHRLALDQMALLEPAMVESIANTCIDLIRETTEEVIARGLDPEAVSDFMLGHVQIGFALMFGQLDWELSAGAKQALREARPMLIRDGWKRVLDDDQVRASVARITGGAAAPVGQLPEHPNVGIKAQMGSLTTVGKQRRAKRLFHQASGRIVVLPLDGALPLGGLDGGDDLAALVGMAAGSDVDAVLLRWGEAKRLAGALASGTGLIVRLSGAGHGGQEPASDVLMNSVDASAAIGADAVCADLKLGSRDDAAMLRDVAEVAEACERLGLVFVCEAVAMTRAGAVDSSSRATAWAARTAQELGADVVKVIYPGSRAAMDEVATCCQVPIVVAGGELAGPADVVRMADEALRGGAAGTAVGRNVVGHPEPSAMQLALSRLVHGECSLEDASDQVVTLR